MRHFKHLLVTLLLCGVNAHAYDFMVDGIAYNKNGKSVIVTNTPYEETVDKVSDIIYEERNGKKYIKAVRYTNTKYTVNYNDVREIQIPEKINYNGIIYSVTSIGPGTFENCSSLTRVIIPNSVTAIGKNAFHGCTNLTRIIIPESVTSIGNDAFLDCSSLASVEFNAVNCGEDVLNNAMFKGCPLKSLIFGDNVRHIPTKIAYDQKELTSIVIPKSVTSIGLYAFSKNLSKITVEAGNTIYDSRNACNAIIRTASNELVFGCKNSVIPNSVTSIGYGAFSGCTGLTSVTIPNSVISIGSWAFSGCNGLTKVIIGKSVKEIHQYAFNCGDNLRAIYMCNPIPPRMDKLAFGGEYSSTYDYYTKTPRLFGIAVLYVPVGSREDYIFHPEWRCFKRIKETVIRNSTPSSSKRVVKNKRK